MTDARRLASAIAASGRAAAPRFKIRIGTVQRIVERSGEPRTYVVNGRPMPCIGDNETKAQIVIGSRVAYLDVDPPLALGRLISD